MRSTGKSPIVSTVCDAGRRFSPVPIRRNRNRPFRRSPFFALLFLAVFAKFVSAGDWPQILGPHRNGIAPGERLTTQWPKSGPPMLWKRPVGTGLAGVAVVGETAVLFHRRDHSEIVEALSVSNGKSQWQATFPTDYVPSFIADDGPRAVPLIHQGRIYVYGAKGGLRCLELASGKVLWTRNTFRDYNSKKPFRGEPPEGYFGIGTSPIVVDGKLIVNIGGDQKGAGIVAFALDSGATIWKATHERASYSSPVLTTVNGVRPLIFLTRLSLLSIDPANGTVRFQVPFGSPGPNVTAANPVAVGDHVFVTASYGFGALFGIPRKNEFQVEWKRDDLLSSQYTTCIHHQGKLFGTHGRQDIGLASLRCLDPKTQKIHWSQEQFGYATLIFADGKLLIMKTDGELIIAAATEDRYQELARTRLFRSTTRALPALSNGRFFARDRNTLKCFLLGG